MIDDVRPNALVRCVGAIDRFAADHWGRTPMLRRGAGPFDDLLDVDAVESLLTDLGRRPTFRLVRAGNPMPVSSYTMRTRVGGTEVADVADVDRILALLADGATVVMQGLQRFWAPLATFCLDIEAVLAHPVQANAYLSPPTAAGLAPHADTHDVIVLQVTGSKQWTIAGLGDVTLDAGDVAYLPAGTRHEARTAVDSSLHITLGLLNTTARDVLRRLVDTIDDATLDRPLPIGYVDAPIETTAAPLSSALEALARHLLETDATSLADDEIARRLQRSRRRWTGRLAAVIDPSTIQLTTMVRRRRPFTLVPHDADPGRVTLRAYDRVLHLPAATTHALARLQRGDEVAVGDLPGLDDHDRHVLVRRLVREGVLVLADHVAPTR